MLEHDFESDTYEEEYDCNRTLQHIFRSNFPVFFLHCLSVVALSVFAQLSVGIAGQSPGVVPTALI